jgi:RNA polymerase sigma-70 factor, ECF subfamily
MSTVQDLPAAAAGPLLSVVPAPPDDLDFDAFVRSHGERLRRLVLRRLRDSSDAEEIAQETLLRAYQHRATFRCEDELVAWSTVVAQRLVIDRARVRGRWVAVSEVPESARLGRDTAEIVVAKAEARTALEALESIPERQAAILWAREVEGLRYDEIAQRFGLTEPAVRSLLHRGRRALRAEYRRRGGTLPVRGLVPLAPWLLGLKVLDRVRTAARGTARVTTKAGAPGLTALAVVGATVLGVTLGPAGGPERPREVRLPGSETEALAYVTPAAGAGTVRDPENAGSPGAAGTGSSAASPTDVALVTVVTPPACAHDVPAGQPCVGTRPHLGERIDVGPQLPQNPAGIEQVSISQSLVPVCDSMPVQRPGVVTCSGSNRYRDGRTTSTSTTTSTTPAVGVLR